MGILCLAHAQQIPDDNWQVWGTHYPTGDPGQDKLLAEGRLRNAMMTADFETFVSVMSSSAAPNVNAPDEDGRTGLHYAAIQGHGGDFNRTKMPWTEQATSSHPWHQIFQFVPGVEMYDLTFLQQVKMYLQANGFPPLDIKARDRSGQTPLHEAALHGNLMTVRWLKENNAFTPSATYLDDDGRRTDDTFLRAKKLHREWAFGWTMMNWAALNARSDIRRRRILNDIQRASENPLNFATTRGMTVLDYAVMSGHADVVDYIVTTQATGTIGLVRAKSNWNEEAIHKAATLGHLDVFKVLLRVGGCTVLTVASEGGEVPLHNAAGGGHAEVLQHAKTQCPTQFATHSRTTTKINADTTNVRYAWGGETPCQLSSSITQYILEFVETCPDGKCAGHFRSRCTHDGMTFCYRDSDCQALNAQSRCDLDTDNEIESLDMVSHWQSCNLLCGVSASTLCAGNPGSASI